MLTRLYSWFAAGFVVLLLISNASLLVAEQKPNVVFIISDDLGAQSLGCYGNSQCRTPNIDGLAARGVRFTRTYTQSPVCGPSRAALMSGMYSQIIGLTSNGASKNFTKNLDDRPSMSQHFINHGYHAARVSKIYHMRVPGDITAGVNGPDRAESWTERYNCQAPEQWTVGKHEHLTNERLKPDPKRQIHYSLGYGGAFYVVRVASDGAEQAVHQSVYCLRGRNDHLLRTDRWALIRNGKGGVELYDMQADPQQFTSLANDPKYQVTLTDLLARLDAKLKSFGSSADSIKRGTACTELSFSVSI